MDQTHSSLSMEYSVCSWNVGQNWLVIKMNHGDNQNHLSYLLECAACLHSLQGIY